MHFRVSVTLSLVGLLAGSLHAAELIAVADTWVHGAPDYTSSNYGGGQFLRVRARSSRTALIRFNTDSLSSGAEIGATLDLHVLRVIAPGTLQIRPVLSAWDEDEVTFETRPMLGPEVFGTVDIQPGSSGQQVSVDISSLVASWLADPDRNFGLAITADGSAADVYFGTRDVGTAPELVLSVTNFVTVSPNGGDYSDPVTAANQALFGDTWCVNPTREAPCTIRIDEGVYVLTETFDVPEHIFVIGAGKTRTLLVAAPGLEAAARAASPIEDLAIVNRQDSSILRAVGLRSRGAALTRVVIRTEGAIENVGMDLDDPNYVIELVLTDITAADGQNAIAIDMNTGPGEIRAQSSRITAIGAVDANEGITKGRDIGGSVYLTDTHIVASGGRQAIGVGISDEEGGSVTMTGGSVTAFATEHAAGIAGGEYAEDLTIDGARIVVDGPGTAVGIGWTGAVNIVIALTGVLVDSADKAVSALFWDDDALIVEDSQLIGRRVAIDIEPTGRRVSLSIANSRLRGEETIRTDDRAHTITISDSILDGEEGWQEPATVSCIDVLGSDYQPLGADCLPQ